MTGSWSYRRLFAVVATAGCFAGAVGPAQGAVLHDQFATTGSARVSSQNFEPANDQFDSLGADDFLVPAGQVWQLDGVEVSGNKQGTSPITTANVFVFANDGSLPGAPLVSRADVARGQGLADPDLQIPLAQMPALPAGRYWIAVQANLIFNPGANNWWWRDRTPQFGLAAAWRQPGDGFGDGCTAFVIRHACASFPGSAGTPDQAFRLTGASAGSTLRILKAKAKAGGKMRVTVNAPDVGELVVRSKALKAAKRTVAAIGNVTLVLKPKPATLDALEDGALRTRLKVSLTPPGEAALRAKRKARLKP